MKIQKWLVPSRNNKYHPHLLRPAGLSLVVCLLLVINITYNVSSARKFQVLGYATSISNSEIINLSNQQRAANGLGALATNAALMQAAQAKAQDMFANDYWDHVSPSGKTPWYFIQQAGYAYSTAGENLAKNFDTSAGVVNGWMNSPGHRANILNGAFQETGVAVVNGTLQGSETTLVVAMYAAPTSHAAAPAPTTAAPKSTTKSSAPKTTPKPVATPAPAPVAEPQPETAPTPQPTPVTPAPSEAVKTVSPAQPMAAADTTRYISEENVSQRESRTWAQNASLFLLSTLFLVSVLKHTVVWRIHKRGWRHIWLRAHPAAQYTLLFVAILANLVSGVGVVR